MIQWTKMRKERNGRMRPRIVFSKRSRRCEREWIIDDQRSIAFAQEGKEMRDALGLHLAELRERFNKGISSGAKDCRRTASGLRSDFVAPDLPDQMLDPSLQRHNRGAKSIKTIVFRPGCKTRIGSAPVELSSGACEVRAFL